MRKVFCLLSATSLVATSAHAADVDDNATATELAPALIAPPEDKEIVVLGQRDERKPEGKLDTPPLQSPQPITVVTADVYTAQGAVSISDTLNYVAGVQSNPYGPDSRVDGAFIRGISALQFRDGMRDIFSFYASVRSDPYNFSQVEVVRGPASALFGAGSLGGIFNLTSKIPQRTFGGELSLRYGSFDRKEALLDVTGPISSNLSGRIVAKIRDSDTQTDFVRDDRVMFAPSLTFAPSENTSLKLLGLYQEDDGGSTSQFLPLVGTILPNPNGELDRDLFIGKPGWDRYDGRILQGTALLEHRFSDAVRLNAKARYIDSDLTYLTHYPNNYTTPRNPYLDLEQRLIGLYVDGSKARMEIFSTDNHLALGFKTGAVEHKLMVGVDYSWNRVRKIGGFAYEVIDIYSPDYDSLLDYGGGLPQPEYEAERNTQDQLGIYVQNEMRIRDRVSVVLGARQDWTGASSFGGSKQKDNATTLRAGVIGELIPGVSPFVSYTESFEPIAGATSEGNSFVPKRGRQYEAGVKLHPNARTLITFTAYHIKERNTPISDDTTVDPFDQSQAGSLTSKGVEADARATLPGDITLIANASYNEAEIDGTGRQLENVPKVNASLWGTKRVTLNNGMSLFFGGGVRHVGKNKSFSPVDPLTGEPGLPFPDGIKTPAYTLVDALAEISWQRWGLAVNAVNLFDKRYYSACLARGDCFQGQARNVFGTLSYRF